MSSVYYCIPSARPAVEANLVLAKWREMGYKIALWRDDDRDMPICDLVLMNRDYPGYARAVNALVKEVLARDAECDWIVTGGDDVEPDPNHTAEEISYECDRTFLVLGQVRISQVALPNEIKTWGVMQPTGDRWGERPELGNLHPLRTAYIDRVAGSPWMGRQWCERANQGKGPLYPDFEHMFVDEFLQASAQKQGVFWQRSDLTHLHHHWQRGGGKPCPSFLQRVSGPAHWNEAKALFERLKARNFVDGDPLPMEVHA